MLDCAHERDGDGGNSDRENEKESCKIYANLAPKLKSISGAPCESMEQRDRSATGLAKAMGQRGNVWRGEAASRTAFPHGWLSYFVLGLATF